MKSLKLLLVIVLLINLVGCTQSQDANAKRQWSSYRGYYGSGILDDISLPENWDVEEGVNIRWKVEIPGLALSCPVVWEEKLFITSAISEVDNKVLRAGAYVNSYPVEDESVHEWKVYCFSSETGEIIWERTSYTGVPKVKRHPKSTHANCTPATDGKHVVVFFASEGLYCYDVNGQLLWEKDFGKLHAGAFAEHREAIEWEFASSPLIHKGVVLIQCDVRGGSFLAAYDIETGEELWNNPRDEHPGWCTPNIYTYEGREYVVVNGYKHRGAYDFITGEEIWRMSGGGDIPVPTPQIGEDMIYFNSAHGPASPIYAVKKSASGDITLKKDESTNEFVEWSIPRGGSYMHSMLLYNDYLYNVGWNGVVDCIDPATGEKIYRKKLGNTDSFIASPVASDGKIYIISDHGDVYTLKAGPEFEILEENHLNDICMVVPALTDNTIYFRTQKSLIAVSTE
jgi:outer membrane protein assembly factor BamB